jgi:hypothetical protein
MNNVKAFACALGAMLVGSFFSGQAAFAFPEMVRYNYVNCTACHVSPTGGGTLTAYGRETTRDILSTWGAEGEQKAAYFINSPEWLSLGGDYRSAYSYINSATTEAGQNNFMQLDLEAAAQYKKFTFDASLGYQDPTAPNLWSDYLISRRHYIMYHATDELAIRGGRFYPAFGIYSPNHSLAVRSLLNIESPEQVGQGESYNLELSYLGDTYSVIATGIFGRPDDNNAVNHEEGASLVVSRSILDHYKVGVSYLYGGNTGEHRHVAGPYGILGFTEKLYLLTEIDFQDKFLTGAGLGQTLFGFAQINRLGYEVVKGLHLIADQEFARLNFTDITSLKQRYGAGIWWYPRPHLEASFEYQRRQDLSQPSTSYYDYMYFLWHIYI